jgi:hypothetical protein
MIKLKSLIEVRRLGKSLSQSGFNEPLVIIYRAMKGTETELKPNDYITRSKKFAVEHSDHMAAVEGEMYHVMRYVVHSEHVFEADNPGEYFYNGPVVRGKEIHKSEEYL